MKIGILTFWNVPNYGTFLQAYALQKVISNVFPDDEVKQIAYLNKKHYSQYYSVIDKGNRLWLINPKTYINTIKNIKDFKSIKSLKNFLNYYKTIPHTEELNKCTLKKEKFDAVVIGSDIVWDYSIRFFGNDKFLFGNNLNSKKIISYAASFGTVKDNISPEYVKNGLKKLSDISVRDENSLKITQKIIDRKVEIVCDPTLLWDFNNDENIVSPAVKGKYILVYGSFFDEEIIKQIVEYKNKKGLRLICINSLNDANLWCDYTINQQDLNPFQWAGYFKNAEGIMTCTYHGLMFGLIFNKPIVFNPTQFMLDKAQSFIKYLQMDELLLNKNNVDYLLNYDWDKKYEQIYPLKKAVTDKSLKFLKDALRL